MNVGRIIGLIEIKSRESLAVFENASLEQLEDVMGHADVRAYLQRCLPQNIYLASGIRVLPMQNILREMGEASAPGAYIRPYGYLIVATSVGGNAICFHSTTGGVYWADHDSFTKGMIMFERRATGDWDYLYEYSQENVRRAMLLLSDSIEPFLEALLSDQLTAKLNALD